MLMAALKHIVDNIAVSDWQCTVAGDLVPDTQVLGTRSLRSLNNATAKVYGSGTTRQSQRGRTPNAAVVDCSFLRVVPASC